jgi:ornithine cyclodeaminase/alanine dehydrogenase-like protein (mu-crystallin family)
MRDRFAVEVVPVMTPREAVKGCHIVVTAGPILRKPHQTIRAGWLDKGSFASLVDFDSYWHPDAMREASKFCTDDVAQLVHYKEAGYFQDIPPIHADLGELVTGRKAGRENPEEKTMAANLGLAIDDMAVGQKIYERALQSGIGTRLPL